MTKLSSVRKNEKRQFKRQKNEKYLLYQVDDVDENQDVVKSFKSRIPSKQQYRRLKNKQLVQNLVIKKDENYKVVKHKTGILIDKESNHLTSRINIPRLSDATDWQADSPPHSALSFHIQPDWTEFEDNDHFQFVSEMDVDLSKIFKTFNEKRIIGFEYSDDLQIPDDLSDSNLSLWATDLSSHRYDHAVSTIGFIQEIIKANYTSIFSQEFQSSIWANSLAEANAIFIFCESNKYLFQDLMTKEYSDSLQNICLKWTELGTKCSILKSCLEKIVHFGDRKVNMDTTLCVLYEQCVSIMEHGMVYPDPLVVRIIEGIKKIVLTLKSQFNQIKVILDDMFDLSGNYCNTQLDTVDHEITILEQVGNCNRQLTSVIQSIGIYLGKDTKWIREPWGKGQPYDSHGMVIIKSSPGAVRKQKQMDSSLSHFHFKIIFMLLMSMVLLFGSSDVDLLTLVDVCNKNRSASWSGLISPLQLNISQIDI